MDKGNSNVSEPVRATWYSVTKPGWHYLFLDLRQGPLESIAGSPQGTYRSIVKDPILNCIHIDFFLPEPASQTVEAVTFLIDDVELFKQLPNAE